MGLSLLQLQRKFRNAQRERGRGVRKANKTVTGRWADPVAPCEDDKSYNESYG